MIESKLKYRPKHFRLDAPGELRGEPRGASRSLVDVKGYINLRTQIRRLSEPGARLEAYRKAMYAGYATYNDDEFVEPLATQSPDVEDSADILRLQDSLMAKVSAAEKRSAGEGAQLGNKATEPEQASAPETQAGNGNPEAHA